MVLRFVARLEFGVGLDCIASSKCSSSAVEWCLALKSCSLEWD